MDVMSFHEVDFSSVSFGAVGGHRLCLGAVVVLGKVIFPLSPTFFSCLHDEFFKERCFNGGCGVGKSSTPIATVLIWLFG